MRKELNTIETIEQYLAGQLPPEEHAAFERTLETDPALREALRLQQDLAAGAMRTADRRHIQLAGRNYHSGRNVRNWIIGVGAGIVVITTAVLLFPRNTNSRAVASVRKATSVISPRLNEQGTAEWATADSLIPAQVFLVNGAKDTVIETSAGMVLAVPAGAFTGPDGKIVDETITLSIKEALTPAAIVRAGLSTYSGDQLLETGGMFCVDARTESHILKVNPAMPLQAQVPANELKPGMQAFRGVRMPGGGIDWADPVPLRDELLAVPFEDLDFYPIEYLEMLQKGGYPVSDRPFTDSVYYSFAYLFRSNEFGLPARKPRPESNIDSVANPDFGCGINPAKIKAIRTTEYSRTLLATREFEERIKVIHTALDPALLDLYVSNLSKPMYEIDAMAARASRGVTRKSFERFAAQRKGRMSTDSRQARLLQEYFARKTDILTTAIAATEEKIRREIEAEDSRAAARRGDRNARLAAGIEQNFAQEMEINIAGAYRQMGLNRPPAQAPGNWRTPAAQGWQVRASLSRPAAFYSVTIAAVGWFNIDRLVAVTSTRTTSTLTDAQTGKTAVTSYAPLLVQVPGEDSFDRVLMYLMPDKLTSFVQMKQEGAVFTERLNGSLSYSLVGVAYRGGKLYFCRRNTITSGTYSDIRFELTDANGLAKALAAMNRSPLVAQMQQEVAFAVLDLQYEAVQATRHQWNFFVDHLREKLFPCFEMEALAEPQERYTVPDQAPPAGRVILDPGRLNAVPARPSNFKPN